MANKQQTAVEWAFEQISNIDWKHLSDSDRNDLFNQAIQMEREQIETAYWDGGQDVPINKNRCAEYYEQTYGTKPSH